MSWKMRVDRGQDKHDSVCTDRDTMPFYKEIPCLNTRREEGGKGDYICSEAVPL